MTPISVARTMLILSVDITIAPGLLRELLNTPASANTTISLFDDSPPVSKAAPFVSYVNDEAAYRLAFNTSKSEGKRKLDEVRHTFLAMSNLS